MDKLQKLGMNILVKNPQDLKPYPDNYNTHPLKQVQELQKSLSGPGKQYKNIVVWKDFIIAGHGLVEAALENGQQEIVVNDVSHLSKEEAEQILVSDNALPQLAIPNKPKLQELLQRFKGVGVPGVTDEWKEQLKLYDADIQKELEPIRKKLFKPVKKVHILLSIPLEHYHEITKAIEVLGKNEHIEILQSGN